MRHFARRYYSKRKITRRKDGTIVQLESQIKSDILKYLNLQPEIGFVWNNRNMGVWDRKTGAYRPSQVHGVPDILGYTKSGRMIGVEVKTPKSKTLVSKVIAGTVSFLRKDVKHIVIQLEFIRHMKVNNCVAFITFSLDEFIIQFEKLKQEGELCRISKN